MRQLPNLKFFRQLVVQQGEAGFALVELIVVIVIMGILARMSTASYDIFTRKTRGFAAQTTLRQIKRECEMSRDLQGEEIFTLGNPNGYLVKSRNTNSCLGESDSGLVSAIPKEIDQYPSYFYNFETGEIYCTYSSRIDNFFIGCKLSNTNTNTNTNENNRITLEEFKERYETAKKEGIVEGPFFTRDDSAYVVVNGPTWEEAEANAKKLGGHLATINNEEENKWVVDTFREWVRFNEKKGDDSGDWRYTPRAYIGLNDKEEEGVYRWSSGEELTYFQPENDYQMTGTRNSYTSLEEGGRPKVQYVDQDYVSLQLGQDSNSQDWNPGYWEDVRNDNWMYSQGVAEVKLNLP